MKYFLVLCLVFCSSFLVRGSLFAQTSNPYQTPQFASLDTVNTAWDSVFCGEITSKVIAVHNVWGSGNLVVAMENDTAGSNAKFFYVPSGVAISVEGQKPRWIRTKSTSGDVFRNILVYINSK